MLEIRRIDEAAKPKKAFLMSGAFNPYTIGHEESARQAAHVAKKTGHTHFYHGIGSSAESHDAPLSSKQKRSVVAASHRHIKKSVKGLKFGVLPQEHDNPFKQVLHLAKTGHTHVTLGLGSDQMKKTALRGSLQKHVTMHGGMKDKEGNVHPVKLAFKKMGKTRDERPLHRTELLTRLNNGDLTVAKAGHLRKAVRSGDTELAHALMPKSVNKQRYQAAIHKAQTKLIKKVHERFVSFGEYIAETTTKKHKARAIGQRIDHILRAQHHIAKNLGQGIDIEDQEPQAKISHKSFEMARDSINRKLRKAIREDIDLIPTDRFDGEERKAYGMKSKNLGEFHPGYDLHQRSVKTKDHRGKAAVKHVFSMVHKASGNVAGEMHAYGGKLHPIKGVEVGTKGKGLKVSHLSVHSNHREKKVGKSLAVEMYRHLHRRGHAIQSDTIQSHGAAHVWNTMRHDPELKKHMMIHDSGKPLRGEVSRLEKRAHRRSENYIWYQSAGERVYGKEKVKGSRGDEPESVKTLVLSGKKQKKKKVVKEDISASVGFIPEAPELDPYIDPGEMEKERFNKSYLKKKKDTYMSFRGSGRDEDKKFVGHRRMGDIHPDYEMWKHTTKMKDKKGYAFHQHQFSIVHKKTREKVGEIDAQAGKINRITGEHIPSTKGKGLRIQYIGIHPEHSSSKVGKSLAIAAYKHLHGKGHSIKSDTIHSSGGAHVWDQLRKDKDVGHHVKYHDERDAIPKSAHKMSYGDIWQRHPAAQETTLVLHAKPKKKVVKEDIEMTNALGKPHGGYYRDFSAMVAGRGIKPKRSGRIAKGYTLHTSKDKDNPKIENHHIVHDATGHVAGEITTGNTHENHHTVIHTDIHGDHTKKKIGKSLAVLAYKHLARKKKGNLWSSTLQTPGGASVWNRIRKDPKMKGRVFHSSTSGDVPAHDVPDKKIWASDRKIERSKNTPEHLGASEKSRKEHETVLRSRLVIRHPKKT